MPLPKKDESPKLNQIKNSYKVKEQGKITIVNRAARS